MVFMVLFRRASSSAVRLHIKETGCSLEDRNVHILDREDGLREESKKPSINRGGGLGYHFPSTYDASLSLLPGQFHTYSDVGFCDQSVLVQAFKRLARDLDDLPRTNSRSTT